MTGSATRHRPLSVEDYLALEEASQVRHEYVAGRMHALASATKRHNTIAGNLFARLRAAISDGSCRVYMSDVKLRAADDVFYYPDVMVACGPEGADPLVEDAPCLVIEVVSPSTAARSSRSTSASRRSAAT